MTFLRALLSRDESEVDTLGLVAMLFALTLCGLAVADFTVDHASGNAPAFAGAAAVLLGAWAAAKTGRDRLTPQPQPETK